MAEEVKTPPVEKKSVAALVLGILSLVFWLLPILGLPIAIIGLVLSIMGVKDKSRYSTAALVCSIIGLVLTLINAAIGAYLGVTGQHPLVNALQN